MAKTKEVDLKEGGRTTYSGLVQQGYLHPARTSDGQKKMKPFRECHGHQRALSPWNKREERERGLCTRHDNTLAVDLTSVQVQSSHDR